MDAFPNNNNQQTKCNTENCKRCRNKYNCSQYVNYLESIASSPVASTIMSENSNILNSALPAVISEKLIAIETQVKTSQESLNSLVEKQSKLDKFLAMFESYATQNGTTSITDAEIVGDKVLVEKKTKGFLGIGAKTQWVEENIESGEDK